MSEQHFIVQFELLYIQLATLFQLLPTLTRPQGSENDPDCFIYLLFWESGL